MEESDINLVSSILAGDVNSYAVLVKRYQRPIYNLMLRMNLSEGDAADLTQDTFLKVYEKLEGFNPLRPLFPWIYTIGLNLARDHLRKVRTAKAAEENLRHHVKVAAPQPGQVDSHPDEADLGHLRDCLGRLPVEYREAVFLRFHEGMEMKEIGRVLGLSVSGAKMRVQRGLAKLRQAFLGEKNERV